MLLSPKSFYIIYIILIQIVGTPCLLPFADTVFLTNPRFVATVHGASLSAPFYFVSLSHFTFWSFLQYFKIFMIIFVMVICDQ